MLDVKLANYRPFVELMTAAGGGMFVTASDDIEALEIAEEDLAGVREALLGSAGRRDPLLVSLAHPSPLSVGRGHGVFALPEVTRRGHCPFLLERTPQRSCSMS